MRTNQLSIAIASMFATIAESQGISKEQVATGYSISPTAVQTMYDEIAQNTELLQKINLRAKTEQLGQIIGLSSGLIASNTDTS